MSAIRNPSFCCDSVRNGSLKIAGAEYKKNHAKKWNTANPVFKLNQALSENTHAVAPGRSTSWLLLNYSPPTKVWERQIYTLYLGLISLRLTVR